MDHVTRGADQQSMRDDQVPIASIAFSWAAVSIRDAEDDLSLRRDEV